VRRLFEHFLHYSPWQATELAAEAWFVGTDFVLAILLVHEQFIRGILCSLEHDTRLQDLVHPSAKVTIEIKRYTL